MSPMGIGAKLDTALAGYRRFKLNRQPGALGAWHREQGEELLWRRLPINADDLVLDVGGYHGDWTARAAWQYGCSSRIYEPVAEFYNLLTARFSANSRVEVVHAGLSGSNERSTISLQADGSSVFRNGGGGQFEEIELLDVSDALSAADREIGCMKINIEGGEYALLERLISQDLLGSVRSFLIQFHAISADSSERRMGIQEALSRTHQKIFDYPFLWERWERRA